jgi:uncharacterized protein (TIGR02145 family)
MKLVSKNRIIIISLIAYVLFNYLAPLIQSCKKLEFDRVLRVKTGEVSNITKNSATITGIIQDVGVHEISLYGHCWDTIEDPEIDLDTKTDLGIRKDIGSFSSDLNNLLSGTNYYVRAYTVSGGNIVYGENVTFVTIKTIPTVNTTIPSNITDTSAICGGEVLSEGVATVTARGVCWSTHENPTLLDNYTNDGSGPGIFASSLTGLSPGTTYYIRAYATNMEGTAYGLQHNFFTLWDNSTVSDIDGNVYPTVQIGEQVWMTENLKTTQLNNGKHFPLITDNAIWSNLSTSAYCWYDNNEFYKKDYGALYNYSAVNTGMLCPLGWHIPTDEEWTTLVDNIGGSKIAGGKLKEFGASHWKSPNIGATNEFGFTALPGGNRGMSGTFYAIGIAGFWWSSTEYKEFNTYYGLYRTIENSGRDIIRDFINEETGYSVRCIKDD